MGEVAAVVNSHWELAGYKPRGLKLADPSGQRAEFLRLVERARAQIGELDVDAVTLGLATRDRKIVV